MVKRIGGFRRKTRYRFRKHRSKKGKISLTNFLQKFKPGDKVHLSVEPGYQKGMYFPMYMGKGGTVLAQRGRCYEVEIADQNKLKTLIIHPVHLKRA
jgi:large subunit ribosomal protein L21e